MNFLYNAVCFIVISALSQLLLNQSFVTSAIIAIIITSIISFIDVTLLVSKHQKDFKSLEGAFYSEMPVFRSNGSHLTKMFKMFKKLNVNLKPFDKYSNGDDEVKRIYKFLRDTQHCYAPIKEDEKYIKSIGMDKICNKTDLILYNNSIRDTVKQQRWEFFIDAMKPGNIRDELIAKYQAEFTNSEFKAQTSADIKRAEEQKQQRMNRPNHLDSELL